MFKEKKLLIILIVLSSLVFSISAKNLRALKINNNQKLVKGYGAENKIGDYLLANSKIKVVISAINHYNGYAKSGGNIIDAVLKNGKDLIDNVHTYYLWPEQIIYKNIKIIKNGKNNNKAVIKATGLHSKHKRLKMTTYYILKPNKNYITIKTKMINKSKKTIKNLPLGDALFFGYASNIFVNGIGFNIKKSKSNLIAGIGENSSYGITTNQKNQKTKEFRKLKLKHSYPLPVFKYTNLKPDKKESYKRQFIIGKGDINSLLKTVYKLRNIETGSISGTIINKKDKKVSHTTVKFIKSDKIASTAITNKNGNFKAKLKPGTYKIKVQKNGYKTKLVKKIKIKKKKNKKLNSLLLNSLKENKFTWKPYLSKVKPNSITISWKTAAVSTAVVKYSLKSIYKKKGFVNKLKINNPKSFHEVELKNLKPNSRYIYQIKTYNPLLKTKKSKKGSFLTSAKNLKKFKFAVYGDTRTYQKRHKKVVDAMSKENLRFIIHTGDLIEDGKKKEQLNNFFNAIKNASKNIPFIPVIGNHERNSVYFYKYFDIYSGGGDFNEQWYSFNYGNIKVIALSSQIITMWNNKKKMKKQTKWLKKELKNSKADFNFIIYHQPSYSSIKPPGNKILRKWWQKIFEKYKVDAVFNADAHSYERFEINNIPYIVTAGGGAPLYDIEQRQPNSLIVDNKFLHYVTVKIKGKEAFFKVKKVLKVPNHEKPKKTRPVSGLLDKFKITAD